MLVMRRCLWLLLVSALLGGMLGCSVAAAPPLPTPIPESFIPTAIAMTVEAANQNLAQQQATLLAPTDTPLPSPTLPDTPEPLTRTPLPPTATHTPTATPTGVSPGVIDLTPLADRPIPYAPLQILEPGAYSKVLSPLALRLYVFPTETRRVWVELLGEDGRLLARKLLLVPGQGDGPQVLITHLPFDVRAAAELGLVRVSMDDEQHRMVVVNSIPVFLLSLGSPDLLPEADLRAPVVIDQPRAGTLVQGGSLVVSGLVRAEEGQRVRLVLYNSSGGEIGGREPLTLPSTEAGYRLFATEVPYRVSASTWALLSVQVYADRPRTVMYLSSVEVLLSP